MNPSLKRLIRGLNLTGYVLAFAAGTAFGIAFIACAVLFNGTGKVQP